VVTCVDWGSGCKGRGACLALLFRVWGLAWGGGCTVACLDVWFRMWGLCAGGMHSVYTACLEGVGLVGGGAACVALGVFVSGGHAPVFAV
jgi:hypothetical protein